MRVKKMNTRKLLATAAGLVGVVIAATAAFAYWTGSGSGTGSATTGTATNVTVVQTSASSGLTPGGSVALSGNFNNANSGSVSVASVTATIDSFSVQPDATKPACTQADFSITGTSNDPGVIASGTGVGSWSGLSLNMTNGAANQDNCKGITVPVTYSAS
jgi:hypothetical protein